MNKRTAMLMAAGVVAALFAGSVALAFGLSGNTAASATSSKPDPIVRTVHRTVRVEKEAKPADRSVQVVTLSSDTTPADAVSIDDAYEDSDSDDAYEDSDADDAYEGEDADDAYEGEDHESEDSASGDSVSEHEDGDQDD